MEKGSLKKRGVEISAEDEQALRDKITTRYKEQTSPYYAAARLWVDAIIDPRDTRKWISEGIRAADGTPDPGPMHVGVLQV
jgi:3-methylcrotonyl-CoA carboxylase beta subunit